MITSTYGIYTLDDVANRVLQDYQKDRTQKFESIIEEYYEAWGKIKGHEKHAFKKAVGTIISGWIRSSRKDHTPPPKKKLLPLGKLPQIRIHF